MQHLAKMKFGELASVESLLNGAKILNRPASESEALVKSFPERDHHSSAPNLFTSRLAKDGLLIYR